MADAVATQILVDGPRNVVMKFTNVSDGTGESAVTKVDVSALQNAPIGVVIERIHFTSNGMQVNILWDADADVLAFSVAQDQTFTLDFNPFGGLTNNAGAGVTGDIKFTTVGAASGDSYTIILEMRKKFG
jgi:hypothetical protein